VGEKKKKAFPNHQQRNCAIDPGCEKKRKKTILVKMQETKKTKEKNPKRKKIGAIKEVDRKKTKKK